MLRQPILAHEDTLPAIAVRALCGNDRNLTDRLRAFLNKFDRQWATAHDPSNPSAHTWVAAIRQLRLAMLPRHPPRCGITPYDEGLVFWWAAAAGYSNGGVDAEYPDDIIGHVPENARAVASYREKLEATDGYALLSRVSPTTEAPERVSAIAVASLRWAAGLGYWSAFWPVPYVKSLRPEESWRATDARRAFPSAYPGEATGMMPVIRMPSLVHAWVLHRWLTEIIPAKAWQGELDAEAGPRVDSHLHARVWVRLRELARPAAEAIDIWTPVPEELPPDAEGYARPDRPEVLHRLRVVGVNAAQLDDDAALGQLAAALLIDRRTYLRDRRRPVRGPRHVRKVVTHLETELGRYFDESVRDVLPAGHEAVAPTHAREMLLRVLCSRSLAPEGVRILNTLHVSAPSFDPVLAAIDCLTPTPLPKTRDDLHRRVATILGLPAYAAAEAATDALYPFRPRFLFQRAAARAADMLGASDAPRDDATLLHGAVFGAQVVEASLRLVLAFLYVASPPCRRALAADRSFKRKVAHLGRSHPLATAVGAVSRANLGMMAAWLNRIDLATSPVPRRSYDVATMVAAIRRLGDHRNAVMHARGSLRPDAEGVLRQIDILASRDFVELLPRRCRLAETGRGLWGPRMLLLDEDGSRVEIFLPKIVTVGRPHAPLDLYALSSDDVWWWRPTLVQAGAIDRDELSAPSA